jgi:hypothetical protein
VGWRRAADGTGFRVGASGVDGDRLHEHETGHQGGGRTELRQHRIDGAVIFVLHLLAAHLLAKLTGAVRTGPARNVASCGFVGPDHMAKP